MYVERRITENNFGEETLNAHLFKLPCFFSFFFFFFFFFFLGGGGFWGGGSCISKLFNDDWLLTILACQHLAAQTYKVLGELL